MKTLRFSEIVTDVLPGVPDCSDPLAEYALRQSSAELCRLSKVWRYQADSQDVVAGQSDYDIEVPNGAALVEVLQCQLNGTDLIARSFSLRKAERGTPRNYTQLDDSTLYLLPTPDSSQRQALTMLVALTPSATANNFPAWIYERYKPAIVAGAKSHLLMMAGKSWTNPNQAVLERRNFLVGVAQASGDAAQGLVRSVLRTKAIY